MFTKDPKDYKRNLNLIEQYVDDAARYISIKKGISYEQAYATIKEAVVPGGKMAMQDPRVAYLASETEGNRELYVGTMEEYLRKIERRGCILSPNLTGYLNPREKVSLLAEYIGGNIKKRKTVKKKMFECDTKGDKEGESFYNILQTTYKVKNNSLSGAHGSEFTPLYLKSAHSSLTSLCRCCATTANAANERFIAGNRHYADVNITINNIVSVVNHSDYAAIERCMTEYSLAYPTVEQTIAVVKRSVDLYWPNNKRFTQVVELVEKLTPIQRAAYCYTGDLWHLKEFNPEFTRDFIKTLIAKDTTPVPNPKGAIQSLDADLVALVSLFSAAILNGNTVYDIIDEGGERLEQVGAIAQHTKEAIAQYRYLYQAFFVTTNVPPNIADFPSSVRRVVVLSDTDSTLFTNQEWTTWYSGQLDFSETSNDVASIMVYLASQLVKHYLAVVSGNLGVVVENIHAVSMKNEYMFPVFVLTGRAKHYFACMSAREGNVYPTPKSEQKGVGLKNSKVPKAIMDGAETLMNDIMDSVIKGKPIDLLGILKSIGDREREIEKSILDGETKYLTTGEVKTKTSYSKPETSAYTNFELWRSVFSDKYGDCGEPPYRAIKASVTVNGKTKFKSWLSSIPDRDIAGRLERWAESNGKEKLTTLYLPSAIVSNSGIPSELKMVIDTRKIIYNVMEAYYIILESLGYFINVGDSIQTLVSDNY